jgi:hypothetical protein
MKLFVAGAAAAIGLAALLLWPSPAITKGMYRLGFFFGLAAFAAIMFSLGASWDVRMGHNTGGFLTSIAIIFAATAPYLLLIESGLAGYRGFSSWVRYLAIVPVILGAIALIAAIIVPISLRR